MKAITEKLCFETFFERRAIKNYHNAKHRLSRARRGSLLAQKVNSLTTMKLEELFVERSIFRDFIILDGFLVKF